jgi:hypothetical protein
MIYNGCKDVEADSEQEAMDKVHDMLNEDINSVHFEFGEVTVDYAEEF